MFLFVLTTACVIFVNLIMSLVANNCIVEVIADTGIDNSTSVMTSKPTGNATNGTALVTEGPRQIITGGSTLGQVSPQNQFGQNMPNAVTGNEVISIPNVNITKEEAMKAEQEANLMIKAYNQKLEQEKQEKAAALAAVQANQTTVAAEGSEGSTTATDETETNGEDEEEEVEEDEGAENENEDEDSEE